MKIEELNSKLTSLFHKGIKLYDLKNQTAKKWYDQEYQLYSNSEFQTDFIYGVSIDGLIIFDFKVKSIDNLFKSFYTQFINKYMVKQLYFDGTEYNNYTKETAAKTIALYLSECRVHKNFMYSTQYGIGMWNLFMPEQLLKTASNKLETLLKSKGIKFYNEYSDACWVYRYLISGNYIDHNNLLNELE